MHHSRSLLVAAAAVASFTTIAAAQTGLKLRNGVVPDTYVDVPYAKTLLPGTGLTVEAWVTYDGSALGSGVRWPTIVRQNTAPGSESYVLRIDAALTSIRRLKFGVRTGLGFKEAFLDLGANELKAWTHVAGTFDGRFVRLMVDGIERVSLDIGSRTALVDAGGTLRIGNGDLLIPGAEAWDGEIDEVRLWPYARTAAEIASTMTLAMTGVPGEVSTWNLDASPRDSSAANHGTDVNQPPYATNALRLATAPATAATFGLASAGCAGTPAIGTSSVAYLGNDAFAVVTVHAATSPGGIGLHGVSLSRLSSPVVLGNAQIWVIGQILVGIPLTPEGLIRLDWKIPEDPTLAYAKLYVQQVFAQQGCTREPFATAGLSITLTPQSALQLVGTPTPSGTSVEPTAVVRATFDQPLDPATVNPTSVTLNDGFRDLEGAVDYDASTRSIVFTPAIRLGLLGTYTLTIRRLLLKAASGARLGSDVIHTFTVRDGTLWTPAVELDPNSTTRWDSVTQAASASGTTLVAWHNNNDIWVRRYEPGNPISALFTPKTQLDTTAGSTPVSTPFATMASSGQGYVAWIQGADVFAAHYLPGPGWSTPFAISLTPNGSLVRNASIAVIESGHALACWIEQPTNRATQKLVASHFDPALARWSTPATLAQASGSTFRTTRAAVTRTSRPELVVLLQNGNDLEAWQRSSSGGTWTGRKLNVTPGRPATFGDALALADGRLLVAWHEDPYTPTSKLEPMANMLDQTGSWGTPLALSTNPGAVRMPPRLSESAGGQVLHAVWSRDGGSEEVMDEATGDPRQPWNKVFPGARQVRLSSGCSKVTKATSMAAGGGTGFSAFFSWIEHNEDSCVSSVWVDRNVPGTGWVKALLSTGGTKNIDLGGSTSAIGETVLVWTEEPSSGSPRLLVRVFR
ncbi:MAG: Ig-like domain-containing protein [Planctomycetes bacterium]|nr:Ig-like domain-containing protein [Planctomycetota bacterium]